MRLALAVMAPMLVLVLLEFSLRIAGYGHSPRFFIPGPQPGTLVSNPGYGVRFFGWQSSRAPMPIVFTPARHPDTYRIVVLGSSAALGDPDCSVSFARVLEGMLAQRFPDVRFEVLNTAMTAIDSHVVRDIAREVARYAPDLYVVYTGNNEVIGPHGVTAGFAGIGSALPVLRIRAWMRGTRTGQWINALAGRVRRRGADAPPQWRGMEAFLGSRAAFGDPRLERVYAHFEANLKDIVGAGRRAGADVILCTLVTNLKDCPPFRSEHRGGLSAEALAGWRVAFERGEARQQAAGTASGTQGGLCPDGASQSDAATGSSGSLGVRHQGDMSPDGVSRSDTAAGYRVALDAYAEAARIDDRFALLAYRMGQCHLALGEYDRARGYFEKARDLDLFRFRADTRINEAIRAVGSGGPEEGRLLIDLERGIRDQAFGLDGIPGGDLLYEHVHLTFAGNYAVAALLYPQVAARIMARRGRALADPAPPSAEDCARWLVYTEFNRFEAAKSMAARMAAPPFTPEQGRRAQEEMRRRLADLTESAVREALDRYRTALAARSEDLLLGANYASILYVTGDNPGAIAQYRALLARYPHASDWHYFLGDALAAEGRPAEAEEWLRGAVKLDPSNADAWGAMGLVLLNTGRAREAVAALRKAVALRPEGGLFHYNLARACHATGAGNEARKHYRIAVGLAPEFGRPPYTLNTVLGTESGEGSR